MHTRTPLTAAALLAFLLSISLSAAQTQGNAIQPDQKLTLKEGSDVKLKFAQELSSKTATEGDPVNFVLADDLTVGNSVVAKAGDKAVGPVTNAKRAGMMTSICRPFLSRQPLT